MNKMFVNVDSVNFDSYVELVANSTSFDLSKQDIINADFIEDFDLNKSVLLTNDECYNLLSKEGDLSFYGLLNINEILLKANKHIVLTNSEFLIIRNHLLKAIEVDDYYKNKKEESLRFDNIFKNVKKDSALLKAIDRVFLSSGEFNVNCSQVLIELDSKIGALVKNINNTCMTYQKNNLDKLMENIVYQRNNRYCLLLKSHHRNLKGIVLGESSSKLAIYFEPDIIIELNNKLVELKEEFNNEVERILKELTELIGKSGETLRVNQEHFVMIDVYFAKARFMSDQKAINASLSDDLVLDLVGARHFEIPIEQVVRNDYYLDNKKRMLLISGPNTGGKTVSLKTIAISLLATYYGLPVLAYQATIGKFNKMFIDIGDLQSIASSLSSFSSHLKTIKDIVDNCDERSMVLVDEIGNGTDPNEGSSFALAVLDYLLEHKSYGVITTHFNQLKEYALSKNDLDIAAMEFDLDKQLPTYRVIKDHTGSSYGLLIARKYAIKEEIVKKAFEYLKENTSDTDILIEKLNLRISLLHEKEMQLNKQQSEVDLIKEELLLKSKKYENYRSELENQYHELYNQQLLTLKKQADKLFENYETTKQDHLNIQLQRELDKLASIESTHEANDIFVVDDYIKIKSTGQIGKVIEVKGNNVVVEVNGIKLKTKTNKLDKTEYEVKKEKSLVSRPKSKSGLALSLNIVGLRVDEAIPEVSKYLDDCLLNNYPSATIIHGVGTGALKKAVWDLLNKCKFVSEYRLGEIYEGFSGVTVVSFGDKNAKK